MSIPFTQYLLPNGETRYTSVDMPKEVEDKAFQIISKGGHFSVEILMTGMISITCEKWSNIEQEEETLSIEICENGPGIDRAVENVINRAYDKLFAGG